MTVKNSYISKPEQTIRLQDCYNSIVGINGDEALIRHVSKEMQQLADYLYKTIDARHPVGLWVDGSYNPKKHIAGIGVVIITDPGKDFDQINNICFGKTIKKIDSSIKAEIYALSVGLSYLMDICPDAENVHVYYDCVNSVICAANINSYAPFGSPYTNFKSALKRIRKEKRNVVFEHTKAHHKDTNNEICDVISKHYSKSSMSKSQTQLWAKVRPVITKKEGAYAAKSHNA